MQVGDFFNGRYVIEKVLGRGGMGTVYLARNINTDTLWAIKEVCGAEASEIDLMAEPKLLKKLDHPALPILFDILEQDGKVYMISDYVDGISLDRKLEEEGKIAEEIVIDWAIQLCKALDYLHTLQPNPIIYRDMKPSNIILAGSGVLKLIDFGIAREYKPEFDTDTVYIGTRGYAAPEQYGSGQTSAASDIYSLGITLHQLLTGESPLKAPFELKPIRHYDELLSAEMEEIVAKCTSENYRDRYQSATQLLNALEALQMKAGNRGQEGPGSNGANEEAGYAGDWNQTVIENMTHSCIPGHVFRKLVITIWDNPEFGCELAYMAAKHTNSQVLLADLDLLAPKADLFLNIKRHSERTVQAGVFGHSGLDTVMDAIGKGMLTAEVLRQASMHRKERKNLHIITGNYRIENYEYYSEDSVSKLIDKCYRGFDITILLVNRFIYDAFTLSALLRSDINIAAIRGDVDQLREFNTYIAFLEEKQGLPPENTKFVLFEYDRAYGMSPDEANAATEGNLLGQISFSRKRSRYRNIKSPYISHMEKEVSGEYFKLLIRLGLLPAPSLGQRLRSIKNVIVGGEAKCQL